MNSKVKLTISRTGSVMNGLIKLAMAILIVFPFYWMLITSLKPYEETILFPPTMWPQTFTLSGYMTLFTKMKLGKYVINSIIIAFSILGIQTLVMIPAAYAFAKYKFKGSNLMFSLVLIAFMIPGQITFITVYLMMAKWRLLTTLLPQIIVFGANAFGIFLLRQNFMQVPEEIIECARLDRAREWKIMFKIMLPMAKSTLVTVTLFSFISHWNDYFWPLVMTDIDRIRPLTIAIEKLKDVEYGINWNIIMAGNVLLVLPILIIYIFASRKIIEAFAYKGVK